MNNLKIFALIAAAGKGSRANLPYPKTLYEINGTPILIHLLNKLSFIDEQPTIIINPQGKNMISNCLKKNNRKAHLIFQTHPKGMGDAVLCFKKSKVFNNAKNILLAWGDIPFLNKETINKTLIHHELNENDFTFPTRFVDNPYTLVKRDKNNKIIEIVEIRENPKDNIVKGEREIGLFVFKKKILNYLDKDLEGKYGLLTKEHGFLYIIKHLVISGLKVEGLPIAKNEELISLNAMSDISSI